MVGGAAELSEIFAALANADRLAIVGAMMPCDDSKLPVMTITQLARATSLSRFAASRHLRVLVDVGVVEVARQGRASFHRLRGEALTPIEDWLYATVDALERARRNAPVPGPQFRVAGAA